MFRDTTTYADPEVTESQAKQIFKAAKAMIADRRAWYPGLEKFNETLFSDLDMGESIEANCMLTAVAKTARAAGLNDFRTQDLYDHMKKFTDGYAIHYWNDTHSHAEVMAKMDEIIDQA